MTVVNKEMLQKTSTTIAIEEEKIGLLLGRNKSLISAVYGCYCNGLIYVPLDINWPKERIDFVLSDSKIRTVITNKQYVGVLDSVKKIIVDEDDIINFSAPVNNAGSAYILYTSGSTGVPKGVEIHKESLINFIDGISEIIDFSSNKRIACLTTISFDIFFLESIMALCKDLTIVLANENEQRNPKLMAELIEKNNVDMIQMTPSKMQLLLSRDKELSCLKNVKEIMIGGEPFPLSLLRTLQSKTTAKIYNMYGPTETTIWSTVSELTHKDKIDIGRPIKNTEIYIVDENFCVLPNGQAGEICITGKGLAKGYVGRDDLTAEKFVCLPQKPAIRLYRTGDIGRYLSHGNLEYLGRTDNQVKLRGHRIELEEIESQINQFDGINQSVVIVLETSETDKILEAFYTSDVAVDKKSISNYLSSKLPEYMIPVIFKRLESFIQTANGKIDRKRILECIEIKTEELSTEDFDTIELSDIQKKAFEIIASNLDMKVSDITLETAFAGAGVDSITFIKIIVMLECEFEFEFDDEMLLITKFPTVKSMIEYVASKVQ